jgi:hypothetical protein
LRRMSTRTHPPAANFRPIRPGLCLRCLLSSCRSLLAANGSCLSAPRLHAFSNPCVGLFGTFLVAVLPPRAAAVFRPFSGVP